jgi:hypothetical protein
MDINTRIEFSEITETCDIELDEHTGYHWGETRYNSDDMITEVRHTCQCTRRGYWVPEAAARANGYTG